MARTPTSTVEVEPIQNNGLRFMNSEWNSSISNGELFHLNWDKGLNGVEADLGLFRVLYLEEGVISYKLALDLTGMSTFAVVVVTFIGVGLTQHRSCGE